MHSFPICYSIRVALPIGTVFKLAGRLHLDSHSVLDIVLYFIKKNNNKIFFSSFNTVKERGGLAEYGVRGII